MNQRIRLAIVLTLVFGIALVTFLFSRRSASGIQGKLPREKGQIAFIKYRDNSGNGDVFVLNTTSKTVTQLTTSNKIQRATWSADGESLILRVADSGYSLLNVNTGEMTPTNLDWTYPEGLFPKDKMLSPNGKQVISNTGQSCCMGGKEMLKTEITIADADGTNSRVLSGGGSPAWSPDSKQIAFAAQLKGDADTEIYIINADGSDLRRLVANPGWDSNPVWSPDGKVLYFVKTSYDNFDSPTTRDLFTVAVDGKNLKNEGPVPYEWSYPRWSPDGQRLAFTDDRSGAIIVLKVDGSERLTRHPGLHPAWSPDGMRIAYHNNGAGTSEQSICTVFYLNNAEQCYPDTVRGAYPVWRP
jgi:Tol biopolymer transport system component